MRGKRTRTIAVTSPDGGSKVAARLHDAAWMAALRRPWRPGPLRASEVTELARIIGGRHVPAGARLMTEGEPLRAVGLLEHDDVELTRRRGRRRLVLQTLHPGDLYGDIPFLCRMPPPFSARALTDAGVIEIEAGA